MFFSRNPHSFMPTKINDLVEFCSVFFCFCFVLTHLWCLFVTNDLFCCFSGKCDLTPANDLSEKEKQLFSVATLIVVLLVIVIGCLSVFVVVAIVIGCRRRNPRSSVSYKQLVQDDLDLDS